MQTDSSCPVLSRWMDEDDDGDDGDEDGDENDNVGDYDCDSDANNFRSFFLLDTSMSPTPKKS